jgi:hypothetical protein
VDPRFEQQTGADLDLWNERIRKRSFADTRGLRAWLSKENSTDSAQLLVMKRFGYPVFVTATAAPGL